MCLWGVGYCTFIPISLLSCYVSWGGGNHFLELNFLCVCGGGGALVSDFYLDVL